MENKESSVIHRNWAKPVLGGLLIAVIVLGAVTAFQLQQMGALGSSLTADKDQITNLKGQIASLQTQVGNLSSRASSLEQNDFALTSLLSIYESNFPRLSVSQSCQVFGLTQPDHSVAMHGFVGGVLLKFTNIGNESVVVPVSGVRILLPNGTQALPTPGNNITFYELQSTLIPLTTCDLGYYTPSITGPLSAVTIPADSTAWIAIHPTSLIATGNYVLTFDDVMTTTNQQVSVNSVWISYDCICG